MDLFQYLPLLFYYLFGSIPTEKFYKKLPKKEINNLGPILSKSFFLSISDFLKGLVGAILFPYFMNLFLIRLTSVTFRFFAAYLL